MPTHLETLYNELLVQENIAPEFIEQCKKITDEHGNNLLHAAVKKNDTPTVSLLCKHVPELQKKSNHDNKIPLYQALEENAEQNVINELVKKITSDEVSIYNGTMQNRKTILHLALAKGNEEAVKGILVFWAWRAINQTDYSRIRKNIFDYAISSPNAALMLKLIFEFNPGKPEQKKQYDDQIKAIINSSTSAFISAINKDDFAAVKLLLENSNITPDASFICQAHSPAMIDLLINKGAKINQQVYQNALRLGNTDLVKVCLQDIHVKVELNDLEKAGNEDIINMLIPRLQIDYDALIKKGIKTNNYFLVNFFLNYQPILNQFTIANYRVWLQESLSNPSSGAISDFLIKKIDNAFPEKFDYSYTDNQNKTFLHYACNESNFISLLKRAPKTIYALDNTGNSPLDVFYSQQSYLRKEAIISLISKVASEADLVKQIKELNPKKTLLDYAIEHKNFKLANALFAKGFQPKNFLPCKMPILSWVLDEDANLVKEDTVTLLSNLLKLSNAAELLKDEQQANKNRCLVLVKAVKSNKLDLVNILIALNASLSGGSDYFDPVFLCKNEEVFNALINKQYGTQDLKEIVSKDKNFLTMAIQAKNEFILKKIINSDIVTTENYREVLDVLLKIEAIQEQEELILDLFEKFKSSITDADWQNYFLKGLKNKYHRVIKICLPHIKNANIKDDFFTERERIFYSLREYMAYILTQDKGKETLDTLIEEGLPITLKNEYGNSLLNASILYNDKALFDYLLEKDNSVVNSKNNKLQTPLYYAVENHAGAHFYTQLLAKNANRFELINGKSSLVLALEKELSKEEILALFKTNNNDERLMLAQHINEQGLMAKLIDVNPICALAIINDLKQAKACIDYFKRANEEKTPFAVLLKKLYGWNGDESNQLNALFAEMLTTASDAKNKEQFSQDVKFFVSYQATIPCFLLAYQVNLVSQLAKDCFANDISFKANLSFNKEGDPLINEEKCNNQLKNLLVAATLHAELKEYQKKRQEAKGYGQVKQFTGVTGYILSFGFMSVRRGLGAYSKQEKLDEVGKLIQQLKDYCLNYNSNSEPVNLSLSQFGLHVVNQGDLGKIINRYAKACPIVLEKNLTQVPRT